MMRWKVPMLTYESVEEADTAAGKEGACLAEANKNLLYRGAYNDAREMIVDIVSELTGLVPEIEDSGKKDDKGQPIMVISETDNKYVDRALAQAAKDGHPISDADLQAEIDRRARGYTVKDDKGVEVQVPPISVSIKHTVRQAPKAKKLPANFVVTATGIVEANKTEPFIALVKKDLGEDLVLTGEKDKDIQIVGWALKRHMEWRQSAMLNQYANIGA